MVGPRPHVLLMLPLTVAHHTNPKHNTVFSNVDRLCDTPAQGNGGFKSLNGKRMSCENEHYRQERKARNCSRHTTEEVKGSSNMLLLVINIFSSGAR
jgi:hypothetical protein